MTTRLALEHDRGRLQITSVVVPTGPRPRQADLVLALQSAAELPAGDPRALALSFTVQPGSAGLAALGERLRALADAVGRAAAAAPAASGAEPLSFSLAVGDLVQPAPEAPPAGGQSA